MTPAGSISWPTGRIVRATDRRTMRPPPSSSPAPSRSSRSSRVWTISRAATAGRSRAMRTGWVPSRARRLAGFQRDAAQGGGRVLARRPRRPAEALRHFRVPAGARRPGNRADMGDAEAEELMRDRRRFSRIDRRHICPDAYPHIGIHTPRHIRAHAYIHTGAIVPVCASGYTGARGNARKHIRPAFQNFL